MRNVIYAVVIVLCLSTAGVVIVKSHSEANATGIDPSEQTWTKCLACGYIKQMSLKEFYRLQQAKMAAAGNTMGVPQLTCEKCGRDAVVEAFKCPQCGEISPKNSVPSDFEDRCPKCRFSQIEADRNAYLEKRRQK
jgi:hypothetical protein